MNTLKFAFNGLKRDWYSGELRLIGISILIAVACLSSVSFFTDRVKRGTQKQATELLAADLVLISSKKIQTKYIDAGTSAALIISLSESFRSVVLKNDKLELAEVKAVDSSYPIRGHLRTSDNLFGEEQVNDSIPSRGSAWVDSRLLQALQVDIGQSISLGASELIVEKILTYEPDRGGDLFNIAPRLMMNRADLDKTKLVLPGSRIQYRLLLGGKSERIDAYREQINVEDNDHLSVQGIKDARPEIKSALERAEQFLGLAALVSIALAGLAVAMSAQRFAIRHYDNCAIMRCLGLKQGQITQIYFFQLMLLSLICSFIGCMLGFFAQEVLNQTLIGMTQQPLPDPSWSPVLSGLFAGLITVIAFALPQLVHLREVSPLRVLRKDLSPVPLNNYAIYALAIITLVLLSPWQSGNVNLTLYTVAGLFLTAIALALSAKMMIKLLKKLQPKLKMAARHGLANVTRRSDQSIMQIIGIGIGVTVMLLLTLVRTDLLEGWQNRLPNDAPNYFLINIQPEQVSGIKAQLSASLGTNIELHPMVRGRLIKINDNIINPNDYKDPRANRLAAREFNLSYADEIQIENRLVAGKWWYLDDDSKNYFSVEEGIAKTLGISIGDQLTYSIAGKDILGEVINLRWVEWDSFNVNFFVVSNTAALDSYPSTFISSLFIPESKRSMLIDLVKQYPSITVFDIDAILTQVRIIMNQVIRTVEFVFIFTVLTGIAVLFAALQSTHDERSHESALMSALGANRKQIVSGLVAEFMFLGGITGLLSAIAASVIEMALAEYVFKMDIIIDPLIWLIAPLACCLIIVSTGLFGTRKVLASSPMLMLRKV
ncbi:MAG: ABC transporter permease [Legionellales bacterium]|nr:ABC transporter permease [Legionellales bacterium]